MLNVYVAPQLRHTSGFLESLPEILSILSQALVVAHHYEALSGQCNAALAQRGLKRSDLPRAAYNELTKGN